MDGIDGPDPATVLAQLRASRTDPATELAKLRAAKTPPLSAVPGGAQAVFGPTLGERLGTPSLVPPPPGDTEQQRRVGVLLGADTPRLGDQLIASGHDIAGRELNAVSNFVRAVPGGTLQGIEALGRTGAALAQPFFSPQSAPAERSQAVARAVEPTVAQVNQFYDPRGTAGKVGAFVGAQIPAVAAFEAGLPLAGKVAQGIGVRGLAARIAGTGLAGEVTGGLFSPDTPGEGAAGGLALGAGGELALGGVGALGRRLLGETPMVERRVNIPSAPVTFGRRVGEILDPSLAADRVHPITGMPGAPVWNGVRPLVDANPDLEIVAADGRSLKKLNDTVSPDAADAQVKRQAEAFTQAATEAGLDPRKTVFTPKGDEVYVVAPKGLGQQIGARAKELLGEEPIQGVPTGTRFGVGANTADAEQALNAAKAAEKAPSSGVTGRVPGQLPFTMDVPEAPPTLPASPPPNPESGAATKPLVGGLAGGASGAAYGYATGDDQSSRVTRALAFGAAGATAGALLGRAAESVGEANAPRTSSLPVSSEPVTEGVQGPIRQAEANRIANLNLSPDAQARVENLARQQGPPGHESWETLDARVERARASQVGLTAQDIAAWKRQGLDRVQVGAMNQVLLENQSRLDEIAKGLTDPKTTVETRTALLAEKNVLDHQSFDLFKSLKLGATGAGRDLAALRKTWGLVGDTDAAWTLRGQDVAGRPLSAIERAKLLKFKQAGNRTGALAYLGSLRPEGIGSQALSQWKAGLLGPGAVAAKTVGDITWALAADAAKVPGAAADWLMGLATRERTMAPVFNALDRLRGAAGAEGRQAFQRSLRGQPSVSEEAAGIPPQNTTVGKGVVSRGVAGAHLGGLIGAYQAGPDHRLEGAARGAAIGATAAAAIPQTQPILNALFQGPFRLLKGISESAATGAVRASLANQAETIVRQAGLTGKAAKATVAQLLERPTEEMQLRAAKDALYDTMTNDTQLAGLGRAGQRLFGGAGNVVIPFNRTPASILTKLAVDANPFVAIPVGASEAISTMRQGLREMATDGAVSAATKARQARAAQLIGQGTVMSLPFAYGYWKASRGEASGTVDPEDRTGHATRSELSVPDDAFFQGGRWMKYSRTGLPAMLAALGANTYLLAHPAPEEGPTPTDTTSGGITGAVRNVAANPLADVQAVGRVALDAPFLEGAKQVQQLASGGQSAVEGMQKSLASSLVPSVVRNLASATDSTQRRLTSSADAITAGMPGEGEELFPKRGLLGEAIPRQVRGAQALGSPVTSTRPTTASPLAQPILREWDRLGIPLTPSRPVPGETNEEYDDRTQNLGMILTTIGHEVLQDPEYRTGMTNAERYDWWVKRISHVKAQSTRLAKALVDSRTAQTPQAALDAYRAAQVARDSLTTPAP